MQPNSEKIEAAAELNRLNKVLEVAIATETQTSFKTSSVRSLPLSEVITHPSSRTTSLMMSVLVADLDVRRKQQLQRQSSNASGTRP